MLESQLQIHNSGNIHASRHTVLRDTVQKRVTKQSNKFVMPTYARHKYCTSPTYRISRQTKILSGTFPQAKGAPWCLGSGGARHNAKRTMRSFPVGWMQRHHKHTKLMTKTDDRRNYLSWLWSGRNNEE
jgi:hypothetical protein